MTDVVERLDRMLNPIGNFTELDYEGAIRASKAEIERLRAALREIASTPTCPGAERERLIYIARRALEGCET